MTRVMLLPAATIAHASMLSILPAAALAVTACVLLHTFSLEWLLDYCNAAHRFKRIRLAGIVLALLGIHLVEIVLFGLVYLWLAPDASMMHGSYDGSLADAVYFSLVVYTTVGFGDITPAGDLRLMVGLEALAGLLLITWSASFTYLVMGRLYTANNAPPPEREKPQKKP